MKAGVAMLVSEEVDVKARKIIRETEKHYIVIKESSKGIRQIHRAQ